MLTNEKFDPKMGEDVFFLRMDEQGLKVYKESMNPFIIGPVFRYYSCAEKFREQVLELFEKFGPDVSEFPKLWIK